MISTTAAFDTQIQKDSRTFRAQLLSGTTPIKGEIKKITINKGACGEFTIGSVYSSYIEATLDNCEDLLENKELQLQIGLVVDGSVEYISIGYYTVTKPSRNEYQTTFTAVGRISAKLNCLPTLPTELTLSNLATAITEATGVPIICKGVTLQGTIEEPLAGLTCREILEVITAVLGGFATEDNEGNIVISKFSTDEQISFNGDRTITDPEFNDYDYALTGIKVIVAEERRNEDGTVQPEVSFSEGTPRKTLSLKYMTESLFPAFKDNVVGYTYRPGTIPLALGDPRLEPWDCIKFTDANEQTYTVPCLNIVHTFDGGLSTAIVAPGESESESSTETKGPLVQQIERVAAELITAQEAILKRLRVDEILTDDIKAATGSFTKYLMGIKILGDLIEAETLKANTLIIRGADGIYRRLNLDSLGEATVDSDEKYNQGLDGSVLVKESITAEKINVFDLFAQNILSTGDFNMGGKGALVYDKETDSLDIRARSINIGSSDVVTKDNLEIGGRNLISNGKTMINENYCFGDYTATVSLTNELDERLTDEDGNHFIL